MNKDDSIQNKQSLGHEMCLGVLASVLQLMHGEKKKS